ncbi:hypothetical protein EDD37DRAFT_612821 [Exophiala viscosa]|uniref:Uncharacterized protein n=1 Tax=Exophiala viscosa TaxID=2486360 RepID=A0AAN6DNX8_9EURO|nr:hypothetical protein EDD36DRAFT_468311 [Exophiala viscosa]KAI1620608.1 hypothetical protein EDD37DRAFT_612821 [Exophiala viscosa]
MAGLFFTPSLLAKGTATFFGVVEIIFGVRAIIWPSSFATAHGFIHLNTQFKRGSTEDFSPLVKSSGAQHIASGLGFVALCYLNDMKALGMCMCASSIAGFLDGVVVLNSLPANGESQKSKGSSADSEDEARKSGWAHCIAAALCGATGAYLLTSI